jgi:alpha-beta hydrolase superfamily lysophospholipase
MGMITEISLTPTGSQYDIPGPNGTVIPGRSWGSATDCKAVALLVHGLGAHSGWFEAFARQLKVRRIYAISYDQSGFGKRHRDPFASFTHWLDDLVRVFDYLKEQFPNKPVYLIGNSMGGLLALAATQYIQPDGLVLLSPGFDGAPQTFTWQYRLVTIIKAMLRPEMEVALPYDQNLVTRDETARQWISRDPEGRFRLPGKYLLELLKLSNAIKDRGHTVSCPVLLMTAGQDRIINQQVNLSFFERLSAPGKKHKHFPDAWHDLMFDPVVDEVSDEVVSWIGANASERLISG